MAPSDAGVRLMVSRSSAAIMETLFPPGPVSRFGSAVAAAMRRLSHRSVHTHQRARLEPESVSPGTTGGLGLVEQRAVPVQSELPTQVCVEDRRVAGDLAA